MATSTFFLILFFFSYFFLFSGKKLSLKIKLSKGNDLLKSIHHLEEEVFCGKIPSLPKNVGYKFFSPLLESILIYSKHFGIPLFNFLKEFKHHLRKDLQHEKSVFKELRDGIFQSIFLASVSFCFWWWSHYFLDIPTSYSKNFKIALFLEGMGIFAYLGFFHIFKRKLIQSFDPFFSSYYLFWGVSLIGLPVVEVLGISQIMDKRSSDKDLGFLQRRMEGLVTSWKEKGFPVKEGVEEVICQLWDLYETRFQVFRRNLKIVNFLIMALFYLPAFFILLLDFIGIFLIELKSGPV